MKNQFLFIVGLMLLSNTLIAQVPKTSNSLSGIWVSTFSENGKTYTDYYAIMQILSADLKVTSISNEKDALDGKVREVFFQDSEKNHNLYKGTIRGNGDIYFFMRYYDDILGDELFISFDIQKKDSNLLIGTFSFLPKSGIGKSTSNSTWQRVRDNFELVNDYGETIRSIK